MNATRQDKAILMLGTLMAALLVSNEAAAQAVTGADDKSFTGAICVPGLATSYTDLDIRATYIKNIATGYRWVACSIPIDSEVAWNQGDANGGTNNGWAAVDITVRYGGSNGATNCTAQVVRKSDGAIIETAVNNINGLAGQYYNISLPNLSMGGAEGSALGVNCLLTPGSRLQVINVEEYAHTHQNTVYP